MAIVDDFKTIGANYHTLFNGWLPLRDEPAPKAGDTPAYTAIRAALGQLGEPESVTEALADPSPRTSSSSDADIRKVMDDVRAIYREKFKNLNPMLFSATKSRPGEANVVLSKGAETWMMFAKRVFERYFMWAEKWLNNEDFFDQDTGLSHSRDMLDAELTRIEIAGLHGVKCHPNAEKLRVEIVYWVLRYQAHNKGRMPEWDTNVTVAQLVKAHINARYLENKAFEEHKAFEAAEMKNKADVRKIVDGIKADGKQKIIVSAEEPVRTSAELRADVRHIVDRIKAGGRNRRVDTGDSIA